MDPWANKICVTGQDRTGGEEIPCGFFDGGLLVPRPPPEPALRGRLVVGATDVKHHAAAVVEGVVRSPGGAAPPAGIHSQLEERGSAARGRAPACSTRVFGHGSLDVEAEVVVGVLRSPPCGRRRLGLGLVVVLLFVEELEVRVVACGLVEQLLREGYAGGGGEVGKVRRHGRRVVVRRLQGVVVVVEWLVHEGLLGGRGGRRGLGRLLLRRRRGHGEGAVHDELLELGHAAVAGLHGNDGGVSGSVVASSS
jgi:hypothetical protein